MKIVGYLLLSQLEIKFGLRFKVAVRQNLSCSTAMLIINLRVIVSLRFASDPLPYFQRQRTPKGYHMGILVSD
jgi:hypothetical protein